MSRFIQYQNKPIFFSDRGNGYVIVLLHGFTESLEIWKNYAEKLSESFRVICIDLPGHGRSANLAEVHTMELMAEVVHAVLHSCGIKRCVMVGHSMGGYVTLAFAASHDDMLQGLVLLHSQADADDDETCRNRDRTIALAKANRSAFINQFIPSLFASANRKKFYREIEILQNQAGSISGKALIAALEGMKIRSDQRNLLSSTSLPVLFIAGKQDSRIPFGKVIEQIALPKHAEALLLEDAGHMGYIEASEVVLQTIRDFTQKIAITL